MISLAFKATNSLKGKGCNDGSMYLGPANVLYPRCLQCLGNDLSGCQHFYRIHDYVGTLNRKQAKIPCHMFVSVNISTMEL